MTRSAKPGRVNTAFGRVEATGDFQKRPKDVGIVWHRPDQGGSDRVGAVLSQRVQKRALAG